MIQSDSYIYIVDDDEAVRDSLYEFFFAENIHVVAFASAESFLAAKPGADNSCLIVDIHMPGITGLELQAELKRQGLEMPIIVITGQGDVSKAVTALKAGAADFIEKPFDPMDLLKIVKNALLQGKDINERKTRSKNARDHLLLLSPRELEVMNLIITGHSNKAIGDKLKISDRTVENHRANVMEKTGCRNLSELISLGLQAKESR
jgi:FixJ family two-component response regulator